MRKYYLFIINDKYYKRYLEREEVLYNVLKNLNKINKKDLYYGIYLYKKMCKLFNVNLIKKYLLDKYNLEYSDKYTIVNNFEKSSFTINSSCIILSTNVNISKLFRILNLYNKNIFVCDFLSEDYFWLNKCLSSKYLKQISYN